jgi:hypothetical protein
MVGDGEDRLRVGIASPLLPIGCNSPERLIGSLEEVSHQSNWRRRRLNGYHQVAPILLGKPDPVLFINIEAIVRMRP